MDPCGRSGPVVAGLNRREASFVERVVPAGPPPPALRLASRLADGSRLWFAIAGVMALRPGLRRAAGEAVAAALLAAGVTQVLNRLAGRPRPPADHPVRRALARQPVTPSFPSSHTAVGFAFTTATARRHPPLAAALAPLAGTLAYGRVRLRVHWPTDVLGGAVLGVAAGRTGGRLRQAIRAAVRRRAPREAGADARGGRAPARPRRRRRGGSPADLVDRSPPTRRAAGRR